MIPYTPMEFQPTTRCLDCGKTFQEAKNNYGHDHCPLCRIANALDRMIQVLEMAR